MYHMGTGLFYFFVFSVLYSLVYLFCVLCTNVCGYDWLSWCTVRSSFTMLWGHGQAAHEDGRLLRSSVAPTLPKAIILDTGRAAGVLGGINLWETLDDKGTTALGLF